MIDVDAFLDTLGAEASAAMRRLLQQAYDRGYREGLAMTGLPAPPAASAGPAPGPTPAASAPPVAWNEAEDMDDGSEDGTDDVEEDAEAARGGAAPGGDHVLRHDMARPVRANTKVGTLRRRIVKVFDLDRFDIDVVICRRGDPDRRQLKSSARLDRYRREET